MYEIDRMPGYINIGNRRGFGHTLRIDVSAWDELEADTWKVAYQRPGETQPYYAPSGNVAVENGVLTWTISEAVTAEGAGSVVIEAYRGDEMLKPSDKSMIIIGTGLETSGDPPTPMSEWLDEANQTLDTLKSIEFTTNGKYLEVNI